MHGSRVWAVYLAVGDHTYNGDLHTLAVTADHLEDLGYTGSGIGDVSCDQGAVEQLGFSPEHQRVAVYFESAALAEQFVAAYDRQEVGTAPVTTYCLD
ncbi:hypothetical protein ACWKWC_11500 [Geodermatophilus nigrescens]